MAAKKASSSGQAWFCTTGLPTDVVIEVGDMSFHLHKFPLMSKSRKLHQLIADGEEDDEIEEVEEDFQHIALPDFPGGADIFEAAAKFCYGVKVEITACSVAALRCAAEYLEMTEEFAEENLVAKTERFLDQSVLRSSRDSVKALKSCENLHTMAEDLGLVQRFVDSITALASATADLSSLSGRAVATLWNGIDYGIRRKNGVRTPAIASAAAADSWFDDLATLGLPFYKRVISAMKDKDLSADVIECSLISYAKRSIPGLSRSNRHQTNANTAAATSASHPMPSETEQKELLETIINNLPHSNKKISSCSSGQFTTRFLFGLLRTANILRASEDSRTVLERKIASHLEHATLDDLLMPSYSYLVETLYDVDCVERILSYFLEELEATAATADSANDGSEEGLQMCNDENKLLMAGKLMDLFLSETASDANLKPDKFCDLAQALPAMARAFDDGLYRSVDVYLKAHPRISDEERERVCRVMDYQKLTLEACTHAAQNERLPLQAVVQVLFFEQLQLRRAIAGTLMATEASEHEEESTQASATNERRERGAWKAPSAIRENQVLRLDMDSMRSRVKGLESECSVLRKAIERMDRRAAASSRGMLVRRLGCKFSTQVCVSHHRTVVAPRKSHRTTTEMN
ncbi:BTB/POZ domain-containing protein At5g66560-like [Zingiber officinale]|uniref:BTB/POZ domain-containing protein At5g66560-like n=1 Tax=Zingiber officinale TaxID=94328 RepID=UPI001C4D2271|nr:BTB/POZ domain-containing protein At5g66560-like [Zingiber officinale]